MILNAFILAAGKGTRLHPRTLLLPKPLLKVGHRRLIEYHLKNLAHSGIKNVYINRAYLRHKFDELLPNGDDFGLNLIYLDEPDGAFETAGALIHFFQRSNADEILMVNGDIWCDFPYQAIKRPAHKKAHIVLVDNPAHNINGDFSIQHNELSIDLKTNSYTFSGIGIYHRDLFQQRPLAPTKLGPLLKENLTQISAQLYKGEWHDIGTIERMDALDKKLLATSS